MEDDDEDTEEALGVRQNLKKKGKKRFKRWMNFLPDA